MKKILLLIVVVVFTGMALFIYKGYSEVEKLKNSAETILPNQKQIQELKNSFKEIKSAGEESIEPYVEQLSDKINLSSLENSSLIQALKSKQLIKVGLSTSEDLIKEKWNELQEVEKKAAKDALNKAERYLDSKKYEDGIDHLKEVASNQQLAIEYFIYERITKDNIPAENLELLIDEVKEIIGID